MPPEQFKTRILILGAGGMLGSAVFRNLSTDPHLEVTGTLRSPEKLVWFNEDLRPHIATNVDITNDGDLLSICAEARPEVVINCVGVIKQADASLDHLTTLELNSVFPHRLARICRLGNARLLHISTDCVFSGKKGNYAEEDFSDANDLYGRSKFLGEVDYPETLTLRTSIIGHELGTSKSLIDWFLSQNGPVQGYSNAIFSGLPSVEIARILREHVIPNPKLQGVYHLSAEPIDKFSLLCLVRDRYGLDTKIVPNGALVIDRSLNSDRFRTAADFTPSSWPELIERMHTDYLALADSRRK